MTQLRLARDSLPDEAIVVCVFARTVEKKQLSHVMVIVYIAELGYDNVPIDKSPPLSPLNPGTSSKYVS